MKSTTAMMYQLISFVLQVGHLTLVQDVRRPQYPHFIWALLHNAKGR
ncbi:MAG TPA: hypothetical protein VFR80_02370 [Pyrinomonadaceae bacterium]|nr:hypothetical protein [Pyrinomonadaceae bacterium]